MALAAAGRAQQTDPILKLNEPEVSLVSETEPLKATVTGGSSLRPVLCGESFTWALQLNFGPGVPVAKS